LSQKGSNRQSTIKYLPYGENSVKIGPADPEIYLLKTKEIDASRTYSPRSMHAAPANLDHNFHSTAKTHEKKRKIDTIPFAV